MKLGIAGVKDILGSSTFSESPDQDVSSRRHKFFQIMKYFIVLGGCFLAAPSFAFGHDCGMMLPLLMTPVIFLGTIVMGIGWFIDKPSDILLYILIAIAALITLPGLLCALIAFAYLRSAYRSVAIVYLILFSIFIISILGIFGIHVF